MSGLNLEYIISATDDFTKTFSKFESGLKGLEKTASSFTAVGAGLTAFGVGVAGGLGAAIKTGAEFDAQMSKVKAISGATAEEFEAMRNQALELGSSTSKSASEIASGFQEMAAMGFNATEVMGAMPGIIAASEASGADMAQVASVMASTLNSFSMEATEATRVADILAKTANISAADITDMQYALKYAAPSANALGISLEELSAAIGTIVNSGMQGEQAGTT
ncbi:phage tail tape measure protein, partial [Paenibacillus thailandensis]